MKTVAIIPAKGRSTGLPGKNLRDLCGTPMFAWSILAAKQSMCIDKIVVSTEDKEIADVSKRYGADVHWRPKELAEDHVHTVYVVLDYLENCKKEGIVYDNVIMLLASSPLRTTEDINGAFSVFKEGDCDSIISVCKYDKPLSSIRKVEENMLFPMAPIKNYETQRQDVVDYLVEVNGSIYISTVKHLLNYKSFHQGKIKSFEMRKTHSVDINTIDDFMIAEAILLGYK
jgi:CMP-N-acetylneuraminic acid synthetase